MARCTRYGWFDSRNTGFGRPNPQIHEGMVTQRIVTYVLLLALSTLGSGAQAQEAGLDPGGASPTIIGGLPVPDDLSPQEESPGMDEGPALGGVPVDGGLSLLLAAGVAYGAGRVRRRKANRG